MSASVTDESAFRDPKIRNAAIAIGRSAQRLAVFNAIYFGKTKIKTQEFIRARAGLANTKRVLEEGKKLATERIVKQVKYKGETAYEKIDFYYKNKAAINSLVLKFVSGKIDLRANPQTGHIEIHIKQQSTNGKAIQVTVDDIDSFSKVKTIKRGTVRRYPEEEIKNHLVKIIGEPGKFQDWGGETNDIYTTRLLFKGRRKAAAFALKGGGTKPPLTPKKMGKNGDQIARMFKSPAEIFLVVFDAEIKESITEELESRAENKAGKGKSIYYSTIDGDDLARLFKAY